MNVQVLHFLKKLIRFGRAPQRHAVLGTVCGLYGKTTQYMKSYFFGFKNGFILKLSKAVFRSG